MNPPKANKLSLLFGAKKLERSDRDKNGPEQTHRSYGFRLGLQSDVGSKRSENQDAWGYLLTGSCCLFVVADGMGGSRGGATASTVAVNVVCQKSVLRDREITAESLASAITLANQRVFQLSSEDRKLAGMGTTIVALVFVGKRAIVAHVGDSRIYRLSKEELVPLTRDHSLIQDLLDSGTISEEEAENHPIAHMLTRSLGPTGEVEVEVRIVEKEVELGDKYLLCSDGLLNHVKDEEIREIVLRNDVSLAGEKLLQLALERGGSDNITIQIIEAVSLDSIGALKFPEEGNVEIKVSQTFEVDGEESEQNDLRGGKEEESGTEEQIERGNNSFVVQEGYQISSELIYRIAKLSTVVIVLFLVIAVGYFWSGESDSSELIVSTGEQATRSSIDRSQAVQVKSPEARRDGSAEISAEDGKANAGLANIAEVELNEYELDELDNLVADAEFQLRGDLAGKLLNLSVPSLPEKAFEVIRKRAESSSKVPINWIKEEQGVADLKLQQDSSYSIQSGLRSPDDTSDLIKRKHQVRESLFDLELRARILVTKPSLMSELEQQLNQELQILRDYSLTLEVSEKGLIKNYKHWHRLARGVSERTLIDISNRLAKTDPLFVETFNRYSSALAAYFEADKNWQIDEDNDSLAASVTHANRMLREARNDLYREARSSVVRHLDEGKRLLSEAIILRFYIQSAIDRNNRAIGLLQGYRSLTSSQRRERVQQVVDEYNLKLDELDSFRISISDREELELRKKIAISSVNTD